MNTKRVSSLWVLPLLAAFSASAMADSRAPLVDAAKQGRSEAVRTLLRQPGRVNVRDADGATALHWAVFRNDRPLTEVLLRAGADVNVTTREGVTPLALASSNGNAAMIEALLNAGADLNHAQPGGETALMTASRTGTVDAVQVLLNYGADANATETTRGQTALMWAAGEGNTAAVQALVAAGADIHARAHGPEVAEDKTPSARARAVRRRIDAFTPLLFAVRAGHIDAATALLAAGADPNETSEDGTSALVIATVNAHWEMAAKLLAHGADPNAAAQGWTALHQLVRTRNPNIGQMPAPVPTGRISSIDLAKMLIERGADVNARMTKDMNDGARTRLVWKDCTPLLLAAKASDVEMMRLLAANGADPKAVNAIRDTALMLAAGLAMYHQAEDSGTDEAALEAVTVALAIGAGDVNAADDDGNTALHGAAARELPDVARLLIEHGAKLDIKNSRGATPVMIANGFSIINMQRHPQTIALLTRSMTERGLAVALWPDGQVHAAENVFVTDKRDPGVGSGPEGHGQTHAEATKAIAEPAVSADEK